MVHTTSNPIVEQRLKHKMRLHILEKLVIIHSALKVSVHIH
jgi:hypothetical protein